MTELRNTSLLNVLTGQWAGDPYGMYRELRERGPIQWDEWMSCWLVLGYDEITALATDDRLSGARIEGFYEQLSPVARRELEPLKTALSNMMLFTEPPRHARLRQLIRPGLTPRFIRTMRQEITDLVTGLLDAVDPAAGFDVIGEFSEPLTRNVIARLAGVPRDRTSLLANWQGGLLHAFFTQSRDQNERIAALREVFDEGARARRDGTADDLFSEIVAGRLAGGEYTDDEVFANFLLLIDAGQATTTNLIGTAVLALIDHPDQQALLRQRPKLTAGAVHEFLRYDSSVQFTSRVATADLQIAGTRIERGQSVALVVGSGNRDPRHYPDPDRLYVTRKANDHLSLGHGLHYCLGAALAHAEIEIAVAELLRRTGSLRLTKEPEWLETVNFRFLKELRVRAGER